MTDDVETITAEEEAKLLADWFATVQFDVESSGLPPMAEEEDDEDRAQLHASFIRTWFEDTSEPVPRSLDPEYEYAHQDSGAWSFVDVGMSQKAALTIIENEANFQELFSRINTHHDKVGKFATKSGTGAVASEGDPHTKGSKFDTPVSEVGMTYSAKAAADPAVKHLKAHPEEFADVPVTEVDTKTAKLIATEEFLRSAPIDKVVSGKVPFREGYTAHLYGTDEGLVVVDGHHRVAMYTALGKPMPSKIVDGTTSRFNKAHDKLGKFAPKSGGGGVELIGKGKKTDAQLLEEKPWEKIPGRKVIYSDDAELAAHKLLDRYSAVEPGITAALQETADHVGGRMEGLDFRLKTQESLARKLQEKSAAKGLTVEEYGGKIGDALRYTMIAPEGSYGQTTQTVVDSFRRQDYKVTVENTWTEGSTYKGVNTNMSRNGITFEVQFHTEESLAVKTEQHGLYEVARKASTPPEERAAANAQMMANVAGMATPVGAALIS